MCCLKSADVEKKWAKFSIYSWYCTKGPKFFKGDMIHVTVFISSPVSILDTLLQIMITRFSNLNYK